MSDPLSPATRALLEAAKSDAPRAAARAQMWSAVSTATGVAAAAVKGGAAVGAVGAMTAAASSGKLLVVGAFLGSVLTASVGYGVVRVALGARHESPKTAEVTSPRASESQAKTWVPVGETPTDPASAPASPPQAAIATESASPAKAAASTLQAPRKIVVGSEDALDRAGALLLEVTRRALWRWPIRPLASPRSSSPRRWPFDPSRSVSSVKTPRPRRSTWPCGRSTPVTPSPADGASD
jgi:hypothetical protein